MTVPFVVAIPARLGSTRLPRKPLRLLAGRPLVVHVVERARVAGALEVVVATDSPEIADVVAPLGVGLAMTRADHPSGTDRLAEVATQRGWADDTVVVNLQGDEPFAPASGIVAVAATLAADPGVPMATLATPVASAEQLFDANAVKVVRDARGRALYFSRAPVPWARDVFAARRDALPDGVPFLRHIGIYAYRAAFLRQFTRLPRGLLEDAEALEQLRVLEAGHGIAVGIAPEPFPPGVDTEADLARAEAAMTALGAARQAP
ncbi:MAG: 3-deoxy-manno-octulosonate cytidylyltransferase [Xanthomonadaceae bacterium]|jgi:3-deoxy-manno-octulosonate cytidylyltransferase (CMP-KDO synthetase)|nr:3-deoxy-manno-octulosonate cytidylyltransferase [Xanthomonadaceae bacterium]